MLWRERSRLMSPRLTRRDLLKQGSLAAGSALVGSGLVDAQGPRGRRIEAAGRPVEVRVTQVSALTLRVTVLAVGAGDVQTIPQDGALVEREWPAPIARIQDVGAARPIRAGHLTATIPGDPLTVKIADRDGRAPQELAIDRATGAMTFALGDRPLLGLGEGGPQFDRRGTTDRMRSGQGGYQLRTHGGRVPIAWLVGTGGWAMFVNHPFGTFDFSGSPGRVGPAAPDAAPPLGGLRAAPARAGPPPAPAPRRPPPPRPPFFSSSRRSTRPRSWASTRG